MTRFALPLLAFTAVLFLSGCASQDELGVRRERGQSSLARHIKSWEEGWQRWVDRQDRGAAGFVSAN